MGAAAAVGIPELLGSAFEWMGCSPLPPSHATVENDDRPSLFSIADLLPLHAMAGVPLVFDYLHHALLPGGLSEREALEAALATWPTGVRPVVHYRWAGRAGWGAGGAARGCLARASGCLPRPVLTPC